MEKVRFDPRSVVLEANVIPSRLLGEREGGRRGKEETDRQTQNERQ